MDTQKLKSAIQGQVFTDQETLQEVKTDFGRLIQRKPRVVVLPASVDDVQKIVRLANREGWKITVRGAAHSQSGQSLSEDGILLDMTSLNQVCEVQENMVWVAAGALWSSVIERTFHREVLPPVLTNNLNVTVGGTLSMAGLGVSSHRYGTQADQVAALEVITGDGHLVRCSPRENQDLFNCTRSGLGQFAIITRARLKLRKCLPNVRTYFLLYDDLRNLMRDQRFLMEQQRFDFIESWCAPCVQGLRKLGETRVPFAEWFYPLHVTLEHDGRPPADQDLLQGLNYYRMVNSEDATLYEFIYRLGPVFNMWRESGTWNFAHPWMEVILPWNQAASYIEGVLNNFPPNLLVGGHVLLWPCRGTTSQAPMFVHPEGEYVMGFGVLPAVPHHLVPMVVPLLNRASDLAMKVGGKRYLSGWVDFDSSRWKDHYGPLWDRVVQWKKFYDPEAVLNPGFIQYEAREESESFQE